MRILIANEALSGGGGVETYLATIVPALQAAGHDVGVLHDNPVTEAGPQRIAPEGTWRTGVHDEGLDGRRRARARLRSRRLFLAQHARARRSTRGCWRSGRSSR